MEQRSICLINDSFPPVTDGVANAVVNYAKKPDAGRQTGNRCDACYRTRTIRSSASRLCAIRASI